MSATLATVIYLRVGYLEASAYLSSLRQKESAINHVIPDRALVSSNDRQKHIRQDIR